MKCQKMSKKTNFKIALGDSDGLKNPYREPRTRNVVRGRGRSGRSMRRRGRAKRRQLLRGEGKKACESS